MTELTPPPADVADLMIQMTRLDWPTTEADRLRYFDTLGLHDEETLPPRDDEPDSTRIRFATSLPGVGGTCAMFGAEFLGLSLFCYHEPPVEHSPEARAGYAALRDQLNHYLGRPVEEWGTPTEPACLWRSGPLSIEMYCFQRLRSGVMVGPSHTERSAANDAAHDGYHSGPNKDRPPRG